MHPPDKDLDNLVKQQEDLIASQTKRFLEELFQQHANAPVQVKNVQVTGTNLRDSFLRHNLQPLLSGVHSLSALLENIDKVYVNLAKHNVIDQMLVGLHQLPSRGNTMVVVPVFNTLPLKRFTAKTGTNVGNGEGDGYIQFLFRNIFGGAENLTFDAVTGTKTPSLYLLHYEQPVFSDARFSWETLAHVNTKKLDWIHSSVDSRGLTTRVASRLEKVNWTVSFENNWRTLRNNSLRALEVLTSAGHSFKLALSASMSYDTRNHPVTPTAGQLLKVEVEQSGVCGGIRFTKYTAHGQAAVELSHNHSLLFTLKLGFLNLPRLHVLDRFFIGGPNDVRAFALHGLGPKLGNSALGGDAYVNGGVSLISRIPLAPKDTSFRIQHFVNFGKLVLGPQTLAGVARHFSKEYSVGAGFGLMFNHPVARFELNFVLPLTAHATDYTRKGLQYGIGVLFL